MGNDTGRKLIIDSKELAVSFFNQQQERNANPDAFKPLKMNIPDLDKITGGIRRQELHVIAGGQKSGKTTLMISTMLAMANQLPPEDKALVISLEMPYHSLASKVFANVGRIEVNRFRDYDLEDLDWEPFTQALDTVSRLPILWSTEITGIDLLEKVVKKIENLHVLVIDYFQLFGGGKGFQRRHESLEDISRRLKLMAIEQNIAILVLSQQTREALRSKTSLDANTIAGTQALARDCDSMMIISAVEEGGVELPNVRKIHVPIARNSEAGFSVQTMFLPKYALFGSPATELLTVQPDKNEKYWN